MKKAVDDLITIVSGLPRSGTSLMMKMLDAGGMQILTDNIRKADVDNPRGYYELEKVKRIKEDASWLDEANGKGFKMVSMLLYDLPRNKDYRILFMQRDMNEVLASQRKMLERQKPEEANLDKERMRNLYEKHLKDIELWLKKHNNIKVIYVNYNELMRHPDQKTKQINIFLGEILDERKMIEAVDSALYRNRSEKTGT